MLVWLPLVSHLFNFAEVRALSHPLSCVAASGICRARAFYEQTTAGAVLRDYFDKDRRVRFAAYKQGAIERILMQHALNQHRDLVGSLIYGDQVIAEVALGASASTASELQRNSWVAPPTARSEVS